MTKLHNVDATSEKEYIKSEIAAIEEKCRDQEGFLWQGQSFFVDSVLWLVYGFEAWSEGTVRDIISIHSHTGEGSGGVLDEQLVRAIGAQLLSPLEFLHSSGGRIFRDLRCKNLMVTAEGKIKLQIYTLPSILQEKAPIYKDSLLWASPELLLQERVPGASLTSASALTAVSASVGTPVDVWALGMTLLELALGDPPFSPDLSPSQLFQAIVEGEPPTIPEELAHLWSKGFKEVIASCLTKDASQRATLAELKAHPFFTGAPGPEYIVSHLLAPLPPIESRWKLISQIREQQEAAQKERQALLQAQQQAALQQQLQLQNQVLQQQAQQQGMQTAQQNGFVSSASNISSGGPSIPNDGPSFDTSSLGPSLSNTASNPQTSSNGAGNVGAISSDLTSTIGGLSVSVSNASGANGMHQASSSGDIHNGTSFGSASSAHGSVAPTLNASSASAPATGPLPSSTNGAPLANGSPSVGNLTPRANSTPTGLAVAGNANGNGSANGSASAVDNPFLFDESSYQRGVAMPAVPVIVLPPNAALAAGSAQNSPISNSIAASAAAGTATSAPVNASQEPTRGRFRIVNPGSAAQTPTGSVDMGNNSAAGSAASSAGSAPQTPAPYFSSNSAPTSGEFAGQYSQQGQQQSVAQSHLHPANYGNQYFPQHHHHHQPHYAYGAGGISRRASKTNVNATNSSAAAHHHQASGAAGSASGANVGSAALGTSMHHPLQTPATNVPIEAFLGENERDFFVVFRALPGTMVSVSLEGRVLVISGQIPPLPVSLLKHIQSIDRPASKFERRIPFPADVDSTDIGKEIIRESNLMIIRVKKSPKNIHIGDDMF